MLEAFNASAPLKSIVLKPKRKPWVTHDLRIMMKNRDKAYKKALVTHSDRDLHIYKQLRREVSNAIDTSKNKFTENQINTASDASSKWKVLRKFGCVGSSFISPLTFFSPDQLNTHYASIANSAPPLTPNNLKSLLSSSNSLPQDDLFHFTPVNESEVLACINELKSKATGIDQISVKMLKLSSASILTPLTQIINESLLSGTFPENWKKVTLRPLSKIKSPKVPSDTRPIAQLPEVSKILEKIVHKQLLHFLESKNLLNPRQAGFRKGYNTQTALLGVTEDVRMAIEKRMVTLLILFDFSKAFDTIPHSPLLHKLKNLGCSDVVLSWFFNYLNGRQQAVINESGSVSEWLTTTSGVPQGSVLGPLLFIIYINDLRNALRHCNHMVYADDTQIYLHCRPSKESLFEGIKNLNADAEAVAHWAAENGLALNPNKTKVMILGSQQYVTDVRNLAPPKITLRGIPLDYSDQVKNLGVQLTPTLNFIPQVTNIVRKVKLCPSFITVPSPRAIQKLEEKPC